MTNISVRAINDQLLAAETKKNLRRFVIKPLLNAIDLNESIDSLIEMRNIVVLFVNVVPARTDSKNLIMITDKIYKKLSRYAPMTLLNFFFCSFYFNFYFIFLHYKALFFHTKEFRTKFRFLTKT